MISHRLTENELLTIPTLLNQVYKGNNKDRLEYFALLDEFIRNCEQDLAEYKKNLDSKKFMIIKNTYYRGIEGALIFELEWIKQVENKGRSPDKKANFFNRNFGFGSEVYTKIKSLLQVTGEHPLTDDERLIGLNQFYWLVKKFYPDNQDFLDSIHTLLKEITLRELNRIHTLVGDTLHLDALAEELTKLPIEYTHRTTVKNIKRTQTLDLIKFVTETSRPYFNKIQYSKEKNYFIDASTEAVWCGILLFTMLSIENKEIQYKYTPRFLHSAKTSVLFQCCENILKKFYPAFAQDTEKKLMWLYALLSYLENFAKIQDPTFKNQYQNMQLDKLGGWQAIHAQVKEFIHLEELQKVTPSWKTNMARGLVRFGLGYTIAHYSAATIFTIAEGSAIGALAGPLGFVLTPGLTLVYGWLLEKVSENIVDHTTDAVKLASVNYSQPLGFEEIFNRASPEQQALIRGK